MIRYTLAITCITTTLALGSPHDAVERAAMTREPAEVTRALEGLQSGVEAGDGRATLTAALVHIAAASPANWRPDRPIEEATAHLDQAVELLESIDEDAGKPGERDLLLAMALNGHFVYDRRRSHDLMPRFKKLVERAAAAGASGAPLAVCEGVLAITSGPPTAEMLRPLERGARAAERRGRADWWDMQAFNLLSMCHTFFLGDPRTGAEWAERGLALRPECELLAEYHKPHARPYRETSLNLAAEHAFRRVAEDAAGDGLRIAGADATGVNAIIGCDGLLWLRIEMAAWPAERRLGFNLAIDADDDQSTGMSWWGNGAEFTFDRLATLWVRKDQENVWWGINGFTTSEGAAANRMLKESVGDLVFAVDDERDRLYIGIPPEAISDLPEVPVIVAVGSNQGWGDDVGAPKGFRLGVKP